MLETRPDLVFDAEVCADTVRSYLDTADPTIFVVEAPGREVVGMLVASFVGYRAAAGHIVLQEVLYVRPDWRGTRAAASLMSMLIAWSESLGATEIVGGNDNSYRSGALGRFLARLGFQQVGVSMRRKLKNGRIEIERQGVEAGAG